MNPDSATLPVFDDVMDWEALGHWFWNPHPPMKNSTTIQVAGITYPFGYKVIIVGGEHIVFPTHGFCRIPNNHPNRNLILRNIGILLSEQAITDKGVRRVDMKRLADEGEDYLAEVDAAGFNALLDGIHTEVIEGLERDNANRAKMNKPPRDYSFHEKQLLMVYRGGMSRLDKTKGHDKTSQLEQIKADAEVAPNFIATLRNLKISQLRKRAKQMGAMLDPTAKHEDIIAHLRKMREAEVAAGRQEADFDAALATPAEDEAPEDDMEALLNETIPVDRGVIPGLDENEGEAA